uniref:Uncharacterized protein n=1 Tax=Panagrolaimus sp. PS1159 TaxID=55785 RepID=A0AC35G9B1_9BILA
MAGLVGYQYDSDEETRRFSMSKDDSSPIHLNPTSSNAQNPSTQIVNEDVADEEMPEEDASPEVQIIEGSGGTDSRSPAAPIRQRSPYVGGYAEQWQRRGTPVNVAPEVQQKYNYMFQLKGQGRNLEQELDGNKAFKNPALYEFLMGKFDIDPTGSALPKSARVFNREDFDKDDFYDQLALRQEGSDGGHHKSKSKHH